MGLRGELLNDHRGRKGGLLDGHRGGEGDLRQQGRGASRQAHRQKEAQEDQQPQSIGPGFGEPGFQQPGGRPHSEAQQGTGQRELDQGVQKGSHVLASFRKV